MNVYEKLVINTDGGSRGNPGPSAVGISMSVNQEKIAELSDYIGITTNNVAEYTAVIKALEYLINQNIQSTQIDFVLDSELVVKQIKGLYKIKQPHLQDLNFKIKNLIKLLYTNSQTKEINFNHVLREKNKAADLLVNSCLDSQK